MDRRGPLIFSALLSLTFLASLLSVILLSQGVTPIGPGVLGAPPLQPETVVPPVLGGPAGGGGPLDVSFPSLVGDGSGQGVPAGSIVVAVGGPGIVPVTLPGGEDGDGGEDIDRPPGVVPKQDDPPVDDDGDDDDPTGDGDDRHRTGPGKGHIKAKGQGHHKAKGDGHDGDSAGTDATGHHGKPKKPMKAKKH